MPLTVFGGQNGSDVELWGTDGTTGRTALIKDINSVSNGTGGTLSGAVGNFRVGSGGAMPFAVSGNFAYFSANDGTTGPELWRTDGTAAGTTKITEFATNSGTVDTIDDVFGFSPRNIVATSNGLIFFVGDGPAAVNPATSPARSGIWMYNPGTGAAPTFVAVNDSITNLIAVGNRIYWTTDGGSQGLSTSDGTTTNLNIASGPPAALYDAGGTVYFGTFTNSIKKVLSSAPTTAVTVTAATGAPESFIHTSSHVYITNIQSNQLYVTTTASTTIASLGTFDFGSSPGIHTFGFAALGSKLIFSSNSAAGGEIWVSSGTVGTTGLLKDIVVGAGSSNPHNFITVGSHVFFQATNGNGSVELWKTDGSTDGTVLVDTLFPGGFQPNNYSIATPGELSNMSVSNGILYFSFDDGAHGTELWRSDGTAAGTLMVKELNTAVADQSFQIPNPNQGASFGATGVFTGWSQQTGYELFSSNGTLGGTTLLKDIDPGGGHSSPANFVKAGSKAYFTAFSPTTGVELWVTDGTAAGTSLVVDINPGIGNSFPGSMVAFGNTVYFAADDGNHGTELWVSNGTAAGTYIISDIDPGFSGGVPRGSHPGGFVMSGSQVFFTAFTPSTGRELWVTNGTQAGTHITKNIGPGAAEAQIYSNLLPYNNKVFFAASDGTNGIELWVSDGSDPGTFMLKDLNTSAPGESSNPTDFVLANGKFFFRATIGASSDVFVSDGTAPNTLAVTSGLQSIGTLVTSNNKVFFSGTGTGGQELYVTSGGAATLIDVFPGVTGSNATNLVAFGTGVLFQAQNTAANGTELWFTDGTTTTMVKNINTDSGGSSFPQNFVVVGSKAYFIADDGDNGAELWVTDGTGPNTFMVKNIGPTTTGGSVFPIRGVNDTHLLFRANDGVTGDELWITNGTEAGTFRVTNVIQPSGAFEASAAPDLGFGPSGSFASVPHTLPAGATDETFVGTAETEYFDGLGGNDTIISGGGGDTMIGGSGNDTFFVYSAGDVVGDSSGGGNDRVATHVSYALDPSAEIETFETTEFAGMSAINLTGNVFSQTLIGNDGINVLIGGGGNDTMVAGRGNDTLIGDAGAPTTMNGNRGNDVYFVRHAGDAVVEALGEGTDRIAASLSYALAAGSSIEVLETVSLAATTAINLTGNALNQTIIGNNGNNVLQSGGGNDLLIGAGGNDTFVGSSSASTMEGGSGNDVFFVSDSSDLVVELAGGGTDRIAASTSYTLGAGVHVETLETNLLSGTSAINLAGNSVSQAIIGNDGSNLLTGGGGNDHMIGLAGNDTFVGNANASTMEGGLGNDVFFVNDTSDAVIELSGQGSDRIASSVSYTLLASSEVETIETLNLSGTAAISFTGNVFQNHMIGNNGANTLDGKGGNDTLVGAGGNDTFAFTSALGASNVDAIEGFASGQDKIALDDAIFTTLSGSLPASAFRLGAAAGDADDRVIYNQATGALLYDADGSGAGAAVQFATLTGGVALAASDFLII